MIWPRLSHCLNDDRNIIDCDIDGKANSAANAKQNGSPRLVDAAGPFFNKYPMASVQYFFDSDGLNGQLLAQV